METMDVETETESSEQLSLEQKQPLVREISTAPLCARRPSGPAPSTPGSRGRARTPSSGAQFYAGFHSSEECKINALRAGLSELWSSPLGLTGDFIDLGCGDGRVVIEVAKAFPDRNCIGVELQASLVEKAKTMAKQQKLGGNCTFYAGDLAAVDLSEVSVVFLYFPPMALPSLLTMLSASNLRNGAMVVSADGAWKSRDAQQRRAGHRHAAWQHTQSELLELLQPWRGCWGSADLYFYTWKGNQTDTPEATAARRAEAMSAEAGVKAAAARVSARMKEERAVHEARKEEMLEAAAAAEAQLRANTAAALRRQQALRTPQNMPYPWGRRRSKKPQRPAERLSQFALQMSPYAVHLPQPRAWAAHTQPIAWTSVHEPGAFPALKALPPKADRHRESLRVYCGSVPRRHEWGHEHEPRWPMHGGSFLLAL